MISVFLNFNTWMNSIILTRSVQFECFSIGDVVKKKLIKFLAGKHRNADITNFQVSRILVMHPSKIGDTICLFPLLREIKKNIPHCELDVYASTYNNYLFCNVSEVSHVYIKYRSKDIFKTVYNVLLMRNRKYDLVIDTQAIRLSHILKLLVINGGRVIGNSCANHRYGLKCEDLGVYNDVNPCADLHVTDRLLEFLPLLGITSYANDMWMVLSDSAKSYASSVLCSYSKKRLIGINVEASDDNRSINEAELMQLCDKLLTRLVNVHLFLFCMPDKRNKMLEVVENFGDNIIVEEGVHDIMGSAAFVQKMSVMITPDTSFVHIASALNVPTVGVYQNNRDLIRLWGPRSEFHVIIAPEEHGGSIRGFSLDEVVDAVAVFLD